MYAGFIQRVLISHCINFMLSIEDLCKHYDNRHTGTVWCDLCNYGVKVLIKKMAKKVSLSC